MTDDSEPSSSDQAYAAPADNTPTRMPEGLDDGSFHLFAKTMAQTRMAVCLSDPHQHDMPIVFANRAFLDLTGYGENEVVGRNCRFLQGPRTDPETLQRLRAALEQEDVVVLELLNYRKDGTAFWNALHLGPLYDEDGRLTYYFGSQWDVSDVHAARHGEQQAKLLARELSHRVKNMFAVVSSVVTLIGRHREAVPVAREINERIRALARAYETTLDNPSDQRVDLVPLLEAVLGPYGRDGSVTFEGKPIDMPGPTVSVLGLTLHELATNSVKYGALARGETGRILLQWHREDRGGPDGPVLVLRWNETGGPKLTDGDPEPGSGSAIVGNLLRSARGTIERNWQPEGLAVSITLPVGT